jgi:hypothetical protein
MNKFLTISSWFCIPEQNMLKYELLSRSSCFYLKSKNHNAKKKYTFVSCCHVTHPFKFPKLYTQDWLNYVNEEHIKTIVEIRDENGFISNEFSVENFYIKDEKLDLVLFNLENENEFDFYENPTILSDFKNLEIGKEIEIQGFEQIDENNMISKNVNGVINIIEKDRIFAKTEKILGMGMCGGPIFLKNSDICIGMVEGIVSKVNNDEENELKDHLAFIPSASIHNLLNKFLIE